MDAVIKEYGNYIIAVIACAIIIGAVCFILGLYDSSWIDAAKQTAGSVVNANDVSKGGNGLFGKCVELWLNRVM